MTDTPIFCNQCGQQSAAGATFCTRCGASLVPAGSPAMQPMGAGYVAQPYGGFWIRFIAYIIDSTIVQIVMLPIVFVLFGGYFATHRNFGQDPAQPPDAAFFAMIAILVLCSTVGVWLYEALMTSSSKQGTLGKMVLRLKVTDRNGARLTFGHSTGRFFAKIVSGFTFGIGYIMAGFTDRKQALHDMIAGTLVVKS